MAGAEVAGRGSTVACCARSTANVEEGASHSTLEKGDLQREAALEKEDGSSVATLEEGVNSA